jgi:hypothetical protein
MESGQIARNDVRGSLALAEQQSQRILLIVTSPPHGDQLMLAVLFIN